MRNACRHGESHWTGNYAVFLYGRIRTLRRPYRPASGPFGLIQDKQKINEISFSQVMTGYLFHWRIQTFRMQRWLEIFCLLKFQWVIRPIWWMGCFDLILGVRPDMTQSLGYPGTDPSGTLVCGQCSLFHTPTGSAHRSAHSHFSWRASDCDVATQLLHIQINTGNTMPWPVWRASPTWSKQKAFPLPGTAALWVFWKSREYEFPAFLRDLWQSYARRHGTY